MNAEKQPIDPWESCKPLFDVPSHKIDWKECYIKPDPHSKPNTINLFTYPKPKWSVEFVPECFIHTPKDCNWFHRLMQRLILGFKWKRIKNE